MYLDARGLRKWTKNGVQGLRMGAGWGILSGLTRSSSVTAPLREVRPPPGLQGVQKHGSFLKVHGLSN